MGTAPPHIGIRTFFLKCMGFLISSSAFSIKVQGPQKILPTKSYWIGNGKGYEEWSCRWSLHGKISCTNIIWAMWNVWLFQCKTFLILTFIEFDLFGWWSSIFFHLLLFCFSFSRLFESHLPIFIFSSSILANFTNSFLRILKIQSAMKKKWEKTSLAIRIDHK